MVEEPQERITRWRTLTDAVFGLALGLGAFSLTAFPIRDVTDILMALGLLANSFVIILAIWHDVHRMLRYPFSIGYAALNYLLTFLVAIMPFTFRLILTSDLVEIALILYPCNVMAALFVMALMFQLFLSHNRDSLSRELILWGRESRNFAFIVGIVYAISLFLPADVVFLPLPPDFPPFLKRLVTWSLGWPIAILYGVIYEKVHGIKWASK